MLITSVFNSLLKLLLKIELYSCVLLYSLIIASLKKKEMDKLLSLEVLLVGLL